MDQITIKSREERFLQPIHKQPKSESKLSPREVQFLRPILRTGKAFYVVIPALIVLVLWVLYAWYTQLTQGLSVTGLRTPVGAIWGLYITNFVFFVAISAAGIAIASGIRLFKLKDYIALARMAELATIFSLMMAGMSIVMSIGRPDRLFNLILNFPARLPSSPLIWDVMAVFVYLVFAITYLYIEMREDMARLVGKVKWGWLYKLLLPGYRIGERHRIEKIVFWASIFNFPIMFMMHTTVGWIFGLQVGRPGWYSTIFGPYFVLGAILTGMSVVVILAAIYRKAFQWEEFIRPVVFKGLSKFLMWMSILYLYFILSEFMTVTFAGPSGEQAVWESLTGGEFAPLFWLQNGALVIAFLLFFVNTVFKKAFRIGTTVIASCLVVFALWIVRFLIVVPSLLRPFLPFPTGSYNPSWVEWSLVGGVFAIEILLFMVFTKVFPIMPVTELMAEEEEGNHA